MLGLLRYATAFAAVLMPATCIQLQPGNLESVKAAGKTIIDRMVENYYYGGNPKRYYSDIPGRLPESPTKYYWWETGSMLLTMVDFFALTGDETYNALIKEGLLFQIGANKNYEPANATSSLGNDDQVYWAFAAMAAAESKFPDGDPSWLSLAQAVFNRQTSRWDNATCKGGLRWQVISINAGWDYKNTASNMGYFLLAARLAAYTQNSTYQEYAQQAWDWQASIGLISDKGEVFDGSDVLLQCREINHLRFSYTASMALYGAAIMYKLTNQSAAWETRVNALWKASAETFFIKDKIMTEQSCEQNNPVNCNTDQLSFKATFARFVAASTKYAPWLESEVVDYLYKSASAAAASCLGGPQADLCSTVWFNGPVWDNSHGVGQQMSALSVITSTMIKNSKMPYSNTTGGTSAGDPSAGGGVGLPGTVEYAPITTADRAGAGILTAMVLVSTIGLAWFLCQ